VKSVDRVFQLVGVAYIAAWLIPIQACVIANLRDWSRGAIDPSGCFLWISIHHVAQLALTLLFMKVFAGKTLSEWGFNLREWRLSLRIFGWFCLVYLVPIFFYSAFPNLRSGQPPQFGYPLIPRNVSGVLGFEFLGAGTCEEPLFRGLVMGLLARSWPGKLSMGRFSFPVGGLWATLIFMIAHLSISLAPFSITTDFWQQVGALGLGLYYAAVFYRTGSLLGPVLSHGYSDGIIEVLRYVTAALMR
jgi:membrane protease YdiL (CAAX protease family)